MNSLPISLSLSYYFNWQMSRQYMPFTGITGPRCTPQTLHSYLDWTGPFTFHKQTDKHLNTVGILSALLKQMG